MIRQAYIRGTGRVESVSDFKDFAEYFESADGKKIDSSYLVALEGEKIRKAEKGTRFSELFPKLRYWCSAVLRFIGTIST